MREGASVHTDWIMKRDWDLPRLQLVLIGTACNDISKSTHDDSFDSNYRLEFDVQGIGSFCANHLMAIADEESTIAGR